MGAAAVLFPIPVVGLKVLSTAGTVAGGGDGRYDDMEVGAFCRA